MQLPAIGLPICVLASEALSFCVDALALKSRPGQSCLSFKLRLLLSCTFTKRSSLEAGNF